MKKDLAMEITVPMLSEQDRHVQPRNLLSATQRTSPLHGTAANDADVSTRKQRRFL